MLSSAYGLDDVILNIQQLGPPAQSKVAKKDGGNEGRKDGGREGEKEGRKEGRERERKERMKGGRYKAGSIVGKNKGVRRNCRGVRDG